MPTTDANLTLRFHLRDDVAIEDFDDYSLVLLCGTLELRHINATSRKLLALASENRTIGDIASVLGAEHGAAAETTAATVTAALLEMEKQGIVRRDVSLTQEKRGIMQTDRYLVNPDVSFRPEGDDGAILFNADSDTLEVINPTAVEIWKALSAPCTASEVATRLCTTFDDAPREQVEQDVHAFLNSMTAKGFIGIVESPL